MFQQFINEPPLVAAMTIFEEPEIQTKYDFSKIWIIRLPDCYSYLQTETELMGNTNKNGYYRNSH